MQVEHPLQDARFLHKKQEDEPESSSSASGREVIAAGDIFPFLIEMVIQSELTD